MCSITRKEKFTEIEEGIHTAWSGREQTADSRQQKADSRQQM
jgi:hypothetical protein